MPEVRTPEGFDKYIREFVYGVSDWTEYIEKRKKLLGEEHFESLRIKDPLYSVPTVTGY
jgi:hypothetical protein